MKQAIIVAKKMGGVQVLINFSYCGDSLNKSSYRNLG